MTYQCYKHGACEGWECSICKREAQLEEQNNILKRSSERAEIIAKVNTEAARRQQEALYLLESARIVQQEIQHKEKLAILNEYERKKNEYERKKLDESKKQTRLLFENSIAVEEAYQSGLKLCGFLDLSSIIDSDNELEFAPEAMQDHDIDFELNFDGTLNIFNITPAFISKRLANAFTKGVNESLGKYVFNIDDLQTLVQFVVRAEHFRNGSHEMAPLGLELKSEILGWSNVKCPRIEIKFKIYTNPNDGKLTPSVDRVAISAQLNEMQHTGLSNQRTNLLVSRLLFEQIESAIKDWNDEYRCNQRLEYIRSGGSMQEDPWLHFHAIDIDSLYNKALSIVKENNNPSISFVQRQMGIGYNVAARLLEDMERKGEVSSMNSHGRRSVIQKSDTHNSGPVSNINTDHNKNFESRKSYNSTYWVSGVLFSLFLLYLFK